MRLGVQVPSFSYPNGNEGIGPVLDDVAKIVDGGDFDSMFVMDHFLQIPLPEPFPNNPEEPMMEAYSTLNYLAGRTRRVKLGALVTGSIYRNPAFLIKQVTTLDVLSNGRAWFGIGAGWFEREAKAYSFEYGTWTERFEKLEDILQISKQMWSDENGAFVGSQFKLNETICEPQPLSEPHPPIMIGGMGEKKTLKFVARYGDACNLFMQAGPETLENKLDVLKKHCETENRDYDDIQKTVLGTVDPINQSTDDILDKISKFKDLDLDLLIVNIPKIYQLDQLHQLNDEVLPAISTW